MRHIPRRSSPMQPAQPRSSRPPSNPLPIKNKHNDHQIIRQQHSPKNPRYNNRIPPRQNPVQQIRPHPKRDGLLPQIHRDQHLRCIGIVRVHRVRERKREIEVCAELIDRHAGEVPRPVEVALGCEPVDDEAGWREEEHGEEDWKAHFGFADSVVAFCAVCGESVRGEGEWQREEVAEERGDCYQPRVCLFLLEGRVRYGGSLLPTGLQL